MHQEKYKGSGNFEFFRFWEIDNQTTGCYNVEKRYEMSGMGSGAYWQQCLLGRIKRRNL